MLRCALPDRPLFYCYSGTSLQAEKLFELIKPVMLSLSKHDRFRMILTNLNSF